MGRIYEAMFVVQNDRARNDHEGVVSDLASMIERAGAQVVNVDKWEEKRLAYRIKKHKRATYYLSHLDAPPDAVGKIDRMCSLTDWVLRVLITRDEDGIAIGSDGESRERPAGAPPTPPDAGPPPEGKPSAPEGTSPRSASRVAPRPEDLGVPGKDVEVREEAGDREEPEKSPVEPEE